MSHKGQPSSPLFFAGFRFMQGSGRGVRFEGKPLCEPWVGIYDVSKTCRRFKNALFC
jgi:hypothetical protein